MGHVWKKGLLWKFPSEGVSRADGLGTQMRLGAPRRMFFVLTRDSLAVYPMEGDEELVDLSVALRSVERVTRGIDVTADLELDLGVRNQCVLAVAASSPAERDSWTALLKQIVFEQGSPPAHLLARTLVAEAPSCSLERLRHLLSFGADANGVDVYGNTPLMEAARADNVAVVRELVERGATCSAASAAGSFPLAAAAHAGAVQALAVLLHEAPDADPNFAAPDGRTALHLTACRPEARADIVAFLLERDASPFAMDAQGQTPLHALCARPAADPPAGLAGGELEAWRDRAEREEEAAAELLLAACPAAAGWADEANYTPAMLAAWHGHVGALRVLLASGADPLAENGAGCSVASLAKAGGHRRCAALLGLAGGDLADVRGKEPRLPALPAPPRGRGPERAAPRPRQPQQPQPQARAGAPAGGADGRASDSSSDGAHPPLVLSTSSDSDGGGGGGESSDSGYLLTPRGPQAQPSAPLAAHADRSAPRHRSDAVPKPRSWHYT